MQEEWRRSLSRAYFDRERLASHQLRSFNHFVSEGLQKVIDQKGVIRPDIDIESPGTDPTLQIVLGDIRVESPKAREKDGQERHIYPQEARLRNLTYAAPLFLSMRIVVRSDDDRVLEEDEYRIGRLPIMVHSKKCNLNGHTAKEQIEHGEDPADPGGYFIINGSERVLVCHEDLVQHRLLAEYAGSDQQQPTAKIISQSQGRRTITTVHLDDDNHLSVSFPDAPTALDFPLILRAIGIESDEKISNYFSNNPAIMRFLLAQLEDSEVTESDTALEEVGKILAPRPEYDEEYQRSRAQETLEKHLLPHLTNNEHPSKGKRNKAEALCRMAQACFELALGQREPDDKDHYQHKRLQTAGNLMTDLFRSALNRLERDIKYHVERSDQRQRRIEIGTVLQRDLITSRLEQALATGRWVGGRSGVSQLVDRTNHMSLLSQLHRVSSPLSRSRPHIAARELHGTQWGRLCPSETPEGQNCGLIKHLAQSTLISTTPNEREIIQELINIGVNPK